MATDTQPAPAAAIAPPSQAPPRTLSQEQIDSFALKGYLRWGKVLSDEQVALLRREYDLEFEKAQATNEYRNIAIDDGADLETKKKAAQQMLQIMQMGERNIHFRKLWFEPKILDIVQDLLGPNIQLFHDQALFKPARTGGAVFWHQDNSYWKCTPATLVSCWVTLDDVVKENGAMQVIPGSHLTPVWHDKVESSNALQQIKGVDESKAVAIDLPAGGCMFHHCQTLHMTAPNTTERQRRAFVLHFTTPGTRQFWRGWQVIHVGWSNPMLRMAF